VRCGPPLLNKLSTFLNPNKGSRVVHSTHNQLSHCHLLGIYTCHLTYRSFPRLAPHSCPKAWCFQLLCTHIKVYGHRLLGSLTWVWLTSFTVLVKLQTTSHCS
jgi:hypothetical protein